MVHRNTGVGSRFRVVEAPLDLRFALVWARGRRMEWMEQPMRKQGLLDGPRADGRLAPFGGVEGRKSAGTPLDNPRPAPRLNRAPVRVGVRATAVRERSGSGAGAERERSGSGVGAERERSGSGARAERACAWIKNRFNSVRYT